MRPGARAGFPLVPPTPARVKSILEGTLLKPDRMLGILPPNKGELTVELVVIRRSAARPGPPWPHAPFGTSARTRVDKHPDRHTHARARRNKRRHTPALVRTGGRALVPANPGPPGSATTRVVRAGG